MPTKPEWFDAWLLIALHWKSPVEVLGAADHLNAAIPNYEEWTHACAVLGERGLIELGEPLPRPSEAGVGVVRQANRPDTFSRDLPRLVFALLIDLPVVAAPLPPPRRDKLDEAYRKLRGDV